MKKSVTYKIFSWTFLLCHIITFSYFGAMIRFSLTGISPLSQDYFPDSLFANILGCFIMGICYEWIVNYLKFINNIYFKASIKRIYTCLATGFCGSLTTFSSWQQEAVYNLAKGNLGAYLMKEAVGLLFCIPSFHFGRDVFSFTKHTFKHLTIKSLTNITMIAESIPEESRNHIIVKIHENPSFVVSKKVNESYFLFMLSHLIELVFILIFIGLIICNIIFCILNTEIQKYSIYLTLAPIGSIIRFFTLKLNSKLKLSIPLFTIVVNVVGSIILSIAFHYLDVSVWFGAIANGFCGCLTTVSSFIQDLHVINTKPLKYLYYSLTIAISNTFLIIINVFFN